METTTFRGARRAKVEVVLPLPCQITTTKINSLPGGLHFLVVRIRAKVVKHFDRHGETLQSTTGSKQS